jgi:hypothetical protein
VLAPGAGHTAAKYEQPELRALYTNPPRRLACASAEHRGIYERAAAADSLPMCAAKSSGHGSPSFHSRSSDRREPCPRQHRGRHPRMHGRQSLLSNARPGCKEASRQICLVPSKSRMPLDGTCGDMDRDRSSRTRSIVTKHELNQRAAFCTRDQSVAKSPPDQYYSWLVSPSLADAP